jgi:anti-anti-sigma factor
VAIEDTALDPSTGPRLSVEVEVPPAPAPVRIILSGELDGEEVDRLHRAVAGVPAPGDDRDLRIEASGLTFVDSAGMRALLIFRDRAADSGVRVVVGPVAPNVFRVLEIAGLLDVFGITDPPAPA